MTDHSIILYMPSSKWLIAWFPFSVQYRLSVSTSYLQCMYNTISSFRLIVFRSYPPVILCLCIAQHFIKCEWINLSRNIHIAQFSHRTFNLRYLHPSLHLQLILSLNTISILKLVSFIYGLQKILWVLFVNFCDEIIVQV